MGIVIRDREVSRIRESSHDDELVAGVNLVKYLVISAVQIGPGPAVAGRKRDEITGIVKITKEVSGGELTPVELCRQARTIDGMCHAWEQRDTREERADAPPPFHNLFSLVTIRETFSQ
jgi:hypothetical protein